MTIPVVPARWFLALPPGRPIDLLVVHDMESGEEANTAEACAAYFARIDRPSSAHVCGDNNSRIRCVADKDVAYAAPGANNNGLHYEFAGRAAQTRAEWLDDYGQGLLDIGADQFAEWCTGYDIPVRFVLHDELIAGATAGIRVRGITTHWEITQAFRKSTHTDPGPFFPMDVLLDRIRARLLPARPQPPEDDDDMAVTYCRDTRYNNVFQEPYGGNASSLPDGAKVEEFTHDGRLAGLVWKTWGLSVTLAEAQGLLQRR